MKTYLHFLAMLIIAFITNNAKAAERFVHHEERGSLSQLWDKVGEAPHNFVLTPCKTGEQGPCRSWEKFRGSKSEAFRQARAFAAGRPKNGEQAEAWSSGDHPRMTRARAYELIKYCDGFYAEWDEVIIVPEAAPAPVIEREQEYVAVRPQVVQQETVRYVERQAPPVPVVYKTTNVSILNNLLNGIRICIGGGGGFQPGFAFQQPRYYQPQPQIEYRPCSHCHIPHPPQMPCRQAVQLVQQHGPQIFIHNNSQSVNRNLTYINGQLVDSRTTRSQGPRYTSGPFNGPTGRPFGNGSPGPTYSQIPGTVGYDSHNNRRIW